MKLKYFFLKPGEIFISKDPTVVSTILGSCVSFCIYDQRQKVGGMTHYQLPEGSGSHKYAEPSLRAVLKEFKNRFGSRREDLVVKILGGGAIHSAGSPNFAVGKENIRKARKLAEKYGLRVIGRSVGGAKGRKVEFNTLTGKVRFQFIDSAAAREEEKEVRVNATKESTQQQSKVKRDIKVLVVDDSPVIQKIFAKIINEADGLELVGCASDPLEAIKIRKKRKVDVITLDVNMPHMDGVTYLKRYMSNDPLPTIMISDYSERDSGPILDALASGAFDYLKKPSMEQFEEFGEELIGKIKEAFRSQKVLGVATQGMVKARTLDQVLNDKQLLVIGASTGGTEALKDVLTSMPAHIPPTLIVQHIPPVFSHSFAQRLNGLCPFTVVEAEHNMLVERDHVYIAPGGRHMKVVKDGATLKIKITTDPPVNRFRPSVDYMFNSVAQLKHRQIVAVIMTGMGNDGAKGLLALKEQGAFTIGQNEATCVVYGMPKEAKLIGAVDKEVSLQQIADRICQAFWEKANKS